MGARGGAWLRARLRVWRRWPQALLFAVLAAAYLGGLFERFELSLMDLRFRLDTRPASGSLVVVEIDSESLRQLDIWPWPRDWHADLVDRLLAAGARQVALDIDFSSRSTAAADQRLAASIEAAGGRVILPVFSQPATSASADLHGTRPLPALAAGARLASVTVWPELDSRVRRLQAATDWQGDRMPTLPAALAGGGADAVGTFYVDFGIRPESIPRLSYAEVLAGTADLRPVAGRNVLVGATAVELGDRLPTPIHRILPGPVFLALGYESLVQGRSLQRTGALPTLAVTALLVLLLTPRFRDWSWRRGLPALLGAEAACIGLAWLVQDAAAVSLDIGPWLVVPALSYLLSIIRQVEMQAKRILRQRLAEAEHNAVMSGIVDSSFDAIVTADGEGDVTHFNAAAERLFGRGAAVVVGRSVDELLRLASGAGPLGLLRAGSSLAAPVEVQGLRNGEAAFVGELALRRASLQVDGPLARRLPAGGGFWVLTIRDITLRKAAEAAQAEARAAAEVARTAAETANRAKTEFLATMSHELRTPLNAVLGFSEMIREEMLGPVGLPQYRTYAADIHRSGSHLLEIINDILDTAKIEAGKVDLHEEPVVVADVVGATLRMAAGRPEGRDNPVPIRVQLDDAVPPLLADPRLLKQILLNLVSNALKFTSEGQITVAGAVADDGWFEIAVRDTGIGIAAEDIPKVLQPFQQVDSSNTRHYQGTGLGLSLVRSLVELHGGELRLRSRLGEGTTVTCRFPPDRLDATGRGDHGTDAAPARAVA